MYEPFTLRDDPDYVKWIFRMFVRTGGVLSQRILEAHKCTDEDYALFYPTEPNSVDMLADIRADPKRDFFCLDWDEDSEPYNVYGY